MTVHQFYRKATVARHDTIEHSNRWKSLTGQECIEGLGIDVGLQRRLRRL